MLNKEERIRKRAGIRKNRWLLVFYDLIIYVISYFLLIGMHTDRLAMGSRYMLVHFVVCAVICFSARFFWQIYRQIWRYGGIQSYIKLLLADFQGFCIYCIAYYVLKYVGILPSQHEQLSYSRMIALFSLNLLCALAIRMLYRYAYKCFDQNSPLGQKVFAFIRFISGSKFKIEDKKPTKKIKVAIIGAGKVGTVLAEDLENNDSCPYVPCFFIDKSSDKIGREIHGVPVYSENKVNEEFFHDYGVRDVIIAIPDLSVEEKKDIYNKYSKMGRRVKIYDFPTIESSEPGKRNLRNFDIEELLFRSQIKIQNEATRNYYKDKVVLITGGGGSIGSELCRQIAAMKPKQIVIVDIFENGAYDIQQELRIKYKSKLKINVEIVSVCNKEGLERVFEEYRPNIVLNAAAHKHVPLMEKNCIEAVENNVFGTLNTVEVSEKYGVERVIMVSTDKAVNPTNVMGATKRMCEMIVQAHSASGTKTTFSTTRFGNVLGSAGSVIPLFRKQIANGGPVTITDKRIIRYFMTIPEASQLVLQSGAMAKNGELFVLDMGEPVKIYDLAENMIRLSGMEPGVNIEIVEIGLRDGEKLYEELLVKSEELDKTENELIFIERDTPLSMNEIDEKLQILREAIATGSDDNVRNALKKVVPTFKSPEEVNRVAANA